MSETILHCSRTSDVRDGARSVGLGLMRAVSVLVRLWCGRTYARRSSFTAVLNISIPPTSSMKSTDSPEATKVNGAWLLWAYHLSACSVRRPYNRSV